MVKLMNNNSDSKTRDVSEVSAYPRFLNHSVKVTVFVKLKIALQYINVQRAVLLHTHEYTLTLTHHTLTHFYTCVVSRKRIFT